MVLPTIAPPFSQPSGVLVVQLVALGLILHQSVCLSSRGVAYLLDALAPAFALRLPPSARILLHLALIAAASALLWEPEGFVWRFSTLVVLTFVIASYPRRVSNHLVVAWFFLVPFAVDRTPGDFVALRTVQLLTAAVYAIAAFHKLNRDYLNPQRSCAVHLVVNYLVHKVGRYSRPPILVAYVALFAEITLPFLLLFPSTGAAGLALGLCLHLAFGCVGPAQFSIVMLAGLSAFLPQADLRAIASLVPTWAWVLAICLGCLLGNHSAYRWRLLSILNYVVLFAATATVAIWVGTTSSAASTPPAAITADGVVLLLFVANGLAPYFGAKYEFSLAMFSSLRPDRWNHLLMTAPPTRLMPRYVQIMEVSGLDARGSAAFAATLPEAAQSSYSLGFLVDAFRHVSRECPTTRMRLREASTGEVLDVAASQVPRRRWHEHLGLFPHKIPRAEDEPFWS